MIDCHIEADIICRGSTDIFIDQVVSLAAAKEKNANTHLIELTHFGSNLQVRMDDGCDVIDGTMFAVEITFVCQNNRSQDRLFFRSKTDRMPNRAKYKKEEAFI